MIIRVHKYLIGREARCDVNDRGGNTVWLVCPSGRVGCSSEAYIDLWVERRFVNSGGQMIIYQIIFFLGGGISWFSGGNRGCWSSPTEYKEDTMEHLLPINRQWGGGGVVEGWHKNITELYGGGISYFIPIHTTAYQRHKSCEFSFDSNKET